MDGADETRAGFCWWGLSFFGTSLVYGVFLASANSWLTENR